MKRLIVATAGGGIFIATSEGIKQQEITQNTSLSTLNVTPIAIAKQQQQIFPVHL